jgi:dienelactone hydrolase
MSIHTNTLTYYDGHVELEAFIAHPSTTQSKIPLIILCHAFAGRDGFINEKAQAIASDLGYAAFALDMYGKHVLGKSKEESIALKEPFMKDRALLQRRALIGLNTAQQLSFIDGTRTAVVGFGLGGICALDIARSGAMVKGAVSIYGQLFQPPPHLIKPIHAKILVLQGYLDTIVKPPEVALFEDEMHKAHVDWQLHIYGDAYHAFAAPSANEPHAGLLYNPVAEQRAWHLTELFLKEIMI